MSGNESAKNVESDVVNVDDDFDYAIVLKPDEEYRKVVQRLDQIFDINEESDLDKILHLNSEDDDYDSQEDDDEVWNYCDDENGFVDTPTEKKSRNVSKAQFKQRITILDTQKKLTKDKARRSTAEFNSRYNMNTANARDTFSQGFSTGVIVRRHRAYHEAEAIVMFSNQVTCDYIKWETASSALSKKVRSYHISSRNDSTNTNIENGFDKYGVLSENTTESSYSFHSMLKLIGLVNKGGFHYTELVAVHPAKRLDPTCEAGDQRGTSDFRLSLDEYNEEVSFSLILKTPGTKNQECYTLDIECSSIDSYIVLLSGFRELFEKSRQQRMEEMKDYIEADFNAASYKWPTLYSLWSKSASNASASASTNQSTARSARNEINSSREELERAQTESSTAPNYSRERDPIQLLFSPLASASNSLFRNAALYNLGSPYSQVNDNDNDNDDDKSNEDNNNDEQNTDRSVNRSNQLKCSSNEDKDAIDFPPVQFLGWKAAGTQIWARLKMAGCEVKVVFSWDLSSVLMKIKCPQWRLELVAEQMGMRMKNRSGSLRRFKVSKRDTFRFNSDGTGPFFKSSEKQQIIEYLICSHIADGGAELDEDTELGKFIAQRFPLHKYSELDKLSQRWITFWRIGNLYSKYLNKKYNISMWNMCLMPFTFTVKLVCIYIHHFFSHLLKQPLQEVSDYFGENVAFYFAFLEYYTRWLIFPAVIGSVVFYYQLRDQQLDHYLCLPYTFLLMIWAAFMLVYWRQAVTKHAFDWSVLGYEVEETQRPQFIGTYKKDLLTNEIRKVYPWWKRLLRYSVTIPILVVCLCVMVVTIVKYQEYQNQLYGDYIQNQTENTYSNLFGVQYNQNSVISSADFKSFDFWKIVFLYPLLYSLFVDIFAKVFEQLASTLNKFENHRTQSTYANRFILKVFSFRTIIIFTSLFYCAFFQSSNAPYLTVSVTMFMLMTVGQLWGIFLDVIIPQWIHNYRLREMARKGKNIHQNIETTKTHLDRRLNPESYFVDNKGKRIYTTENLHPIIIEQGRTKQFYRQLEKREKLLKESIDSKEWNEALTDRYNCFNDYTVIVVQLGLVLLFSPVFPLAPMIAFVCNLCMIRFNAYKLCRSRQRPLARKAGGIGVWEDVLQLMSVAGIITNCALFGFTSEQLASRMSSTVLVLVLFLWEHAMLLFKYFLHAVMPKVPARVLRAQARMHAKEDTSGGKSTQTGGWWKTGNLFGRSRKDPKKGESSRGYDNTSNNNNNHDDDDDKDKGDAVRHTVPVHEYEDTDDEHEDGVPHFGIASPSLKESREHTYQSPSKTLRRFNSGAFSPEAIINDSPHHSDDDSIESPRDKASQLQQQLTKQPSVTRDELHKRIASGRDIKQLVPFSNPSSPSLLRDAMKPQPPTKPARTSSLQPLVSSNRKVSPEKPPRRFKQQAQEQQEEYMNQSNSSSVSSDDSESSDDEDNDNSHRNCHLNKAEATTVVIDNREVKLFGVPLVGISNTTTRTSTTGGGSKSNLKKTKSKSNTAPAAMLTSGDNDENSPLKANRSPSRSPMKSRRPNSGV